MFQEMTVTVTGVAPLVLHNGRMADAMDPFAKEVRRLVPKSKKSDDTATLMGIVEWCGSMYHTEGGYTIADGIVQWDKKMRPVIPAANVKAMIIEGARKSKLGKKASAGVMVTHDSLIEYKGPKDLNALMHEPRFMLRKQVRVGQSKVTRSRPIFWTWGATFVFEVNPEAINTEDVLEAIMVAGREVGVCDWKPEHGRFEVIQ